MTYDVTWRVYKTYDIPSRLEGSGDGVSGGVHLRDDQLRLLPRPGCLGVGSLITLKLVRKFEIIRKSANQTHDNNFAKEHILREK